MAARSLPDDSSELRHVPGLGTGGRPFDKIIHEQIRLGILSTLAVNASLSFTELRDMLDSTDGNVSVHARKLEEAGYVSCKKQFEGRTPRTVFRLTRKGRRALTRYLDHMEALIRVARGGESAG